MPSQERLEQLGKSANGADASTTTGRLNEYQHQPAYLANDRDKDNRSYDSQRRPEERRQRDVDNRSLDVSKKPITYWFKIKIRSFYVHQLHNGIFRPSTVHLNPQWTLEIEIREACITIIGQRLILECHPILDVRHLHQDLNTDHVTQTHQ